MKKRARNCSFCGKSASEVDTLVKGADAQICDVCVRAAGDILQGKSNGRHRTDIRPYRIDARLAGLLGSRTLRKYGFVPLDLYEGIIVLAVASLEDVPRITLQLKTALRNAGPPERGTRELDVLVAPRKSIEEKIRELSTV